MSATLAQSIAWDAASPARKRELAGVTTTATDAKDQQSETCAVDLAPPVVPSEPQAA